MPHDSPLCRAWCLELQPILIQVLPLPSRPAPVLACDAGMMPVVFAAKLNHRRRLREARQQMQPPSAHAPRLQPPPQGPPDLPPSPPPLSAEPSLPPSCRGLLHPVPPSPLEPTACSNSVTPPVELPAASRSSAEGSADLERLPNPHANPRPSLSPLPQSSNWELIPHAVCVRPPRLASVGDRGGSFTLVRSLTRTKMLVGGAAAEPTSELAKRPPRSSRAGWSACRNAMRLRRHNANAALPPPTLAQIRSTSRDSSAAARLLHSDRRRGGYVPTNQWLDEPIPNPRLPTHPCLRTDQVGGARRGSRRTRAYRAAAGRSVQLPASACG